jgi:predicted transcriptional regulator
MATREITIKESRGKFSIFKGNSKQEAYDFSGISALRQILSNEKSRILNVIKIQKPSSIYALSKQLNRNFKGVYNDIKLLERFGFIELIKDRTKNREKLKPILTSDVITIHFKV